jgi:hypothetical protein
MRGDSARAAAARISSAMATGRAALATSRTTTLMRGWGLRRRRRGLRVRLGRAACRGQPQEDEKRRDGCGPDANVSPAALAVYVREPRAPA